MTTAAIAIQDIYEADYQTCYGCGTNNNDGMHLKSYWRDGKVVADYLPRNHEKGIEGFVYGGLIASLIDCHAIATAGAYRQNEQSLTKVPRFVTGSLHVDYLKPTPLSDVPIHLQARVVETSERKSKVVVELSVGDTLCARGEVVAVRIPETMQAKT
ncbi:MAG: PaaI family thioesterase [Arenicella sp.]